MIKLVNAEDDTYICYVKNDEDKSKKSSVAGKSGTAVAEVSLMIALT